MMISFIAVLCAQTIATTGGPEFSFEKPCICVTGTGASTTLALTAEYQLTLYADTAAETESMAKTLAENMRKEIVRAVKELGGKENDVVLSNITVNPPIDTDPFYRINQDIHVTLKNVKDINKVKEKFILINRVQVGTVTPVVNDKSNYEPAIEEARLDAVKNLQTEAKALAQAMNVILGEPLYITENIVYPFSDNYDVASVSASELKVTITTYYEILYKR